MCHPCNQSVVNSLEAASPVVSQNTNDKKKDIYDPGWVIKPTCTETHKVLLSIKIHWGPNKKDPEVPRHRSSVGSRSGATTFNVTRGLAGGLLGFMWAHVDPVATYRHGERCWMNTKSRRMMWNDYQLSEISIGFFKKFLPCWDRCMTRFRFRNLTLQDGHAECVFREVHDSRIGPRPNTQCKHKIY